MKPLKLLMASLILLSALSCSKAEEGDLTISPIGATSYLINASAQSCTNVVAVYKNSTVARTTDVAPYYFNYQGLSMSWKNLTDTAYIVSLDFEFTSNSFNYTCSISGDELNALFYDFSGKVDWDGSLAPAASATSPTTKDSGSLCRIRCGGASVTDPKKPFTVTGTMTMKGFQRSPTGDEKPFKAKSSMKLIYQ